MSWNTTFLAQRTKSGLGKAHYFAGLGLPGAKEVGTVNFDEAVSSTLPGKALGVIQQWTIVIDPFMFMEVANHPSFKGSSLLPIVVESRLLPSTDRWPAYAFVAYGTSGTYGFAAYENRRRTRLILRQEGRTIYDEGAPVFSGDAWPGDADEEDTVLGLLPEVTTISFQQLEEAEFSLFEFDAGHIAFVHED